MRTARSNSLPAAPPEIERATLEYLAALQCEDAAYDELQRLTRAHDPAREHALAEYARLRWLASEARYRLHQSFAGRPGFFIVAGHLVSLYGPVTRRDPLSVRPITSHGKGARS